MLTTLREGAKSGFLKYILVAFIGFAVLGLVFVDMSGAFRGGGVGSSSVARVGDTEISVSRFRSEFQAAENRAGMGAIPPQMREQLALQVVDQQVRERVFQLESHDMGLLISDQLAALEIRRQLQPLMEGGLTAEQALAQRLRAVGMSESRFVAAFKQDMAMRQLINAVTLGSYAPDQMIETAYKYENQARSGQYIALTPERFADDVGTPSTEELENFYDENINNYLTDEYREISYLIFDQEDAALPETIPEEELRQAYQDRIRSYTEPAGLIVDQAVFSSADTAQAVVAEAFDSQDLDSALAALSDGDYILLEDERVTEQDTVEDIADAAFNTPIGEIAGPIQSSLGWIVLKVKSETEEAVRPFEEVRDSLETTYRQEEQDNRLYDMANDIDNMLVRNLPLQDIAAEFSLNVYQTPLLTEEGRTQEGRSAELLQQDFATDLLAEAFALRQDEIPPLLEMDDGRFVAYNASRIAPPEPIALEDIRDEVIEDWRQHQINSKLSELTTRLVDALGEDRTLTELAAEHDLSLQEIPSITGTDAASNEDLPSSALQALFQMNEVNDFTTAPTEDGIMIMQLDSIIFPETNGTTEELEALRSSVMEQIRTELVTQYEQSLREKYDVRISENTIRRVIQPADDMY